jgi:hypothetical protein
MMVGAFCGFDYFIDKGDRLNEVFELALAL